MKLVIEIDEKYYNDIKNSKSVNNYSVLYALDGIRNGTPLPKGHVEQKQIDLEDFAKWVASEIFDESWEYNKDSFEEIACRKLEKLGIVRSNGDVWELIDKENCR